MAFISYLSYVQMNVEILQKREDEIAVGVARLIMNFPIIVRRIKWESRNKNIDHNPAIFTLLLV